MTDRFEDCLLAAKSELSAAKRIVQSEIASYPGPISGCDAQFNHLLAERQKILSALRALEKPVFVPTPRTPTPQSGVESR